LRRFLSMSAAIGAGYVLFEARKVTEPGVLPLARFPAQLAPMSQEPADQLPRVVLVRGSAVDEDRLLIPHQGYPAEPCDQRLLAHAFRLWPRSTCVAVWRLDLGPVPAAILTTETVLCCQGLSIEVGRPNTAVEAQTSWRAVVLDDAPVLGPVGLTMSKSFKVLHADLCHGLPCAGKGHAWP